MTVCNVSCTILMSLSRCSQGYMGTAWARRPGWDMPWCAAGILERYPAQTARMRQGGFWDSATDLLPKYLMLVSASLPVHPPHHKARTASSLR